jgi:hypothetical protein
MNTKLRVAAGEGGWSVLGSGPFVDGAGSDAIVHRYDSDGPCEGEEDTLFADGFDGVTQAIADARNP